MKLHCAHENVVVVRAVAHEHHAVSVETISRHCEHELSICCLKALMIKSLDGRMDELTGYEQKQGKLSAHESRSNKKPESEQDQNWFLIRKCNSTL